MKNKLILFILLAGAIIGGSLSAIYKTNHYKPTKNVINLNKLYQLPAIDKNHNFPLLRKQPKTFKLAIASMMSPVATGKRGQIYLFTFK